MSVSQDGHPPAGSQPDAFVSSWNAWQEQRFSAAKAPYGPSSLTLTRWVRDENPQEIPDIPGVWAAQDGTLVATGFKEGEYLNATGEPLSAPLRLKPGTPEAGVYAEVYSRDRLVRAFDREGVLAVRIFDPESPSRRFLESIEAFTPNLRWSVEARFEPGERTLPLELADGHQTRAEVSGDLVFNIDGAEHRLVGSLRGESISVVFGDQTNGAESYGFRFLTVPAPDQHSRTVVDFNRAYLPPCAFSHQFVCPLPVAGNRLPIRVEAGERLPIRR